MTLRQLVAVVDDDESVRDSLPPLLRSYGFEVESFSSGKEFLEADGHHRVRCLVLDVAMPGMSGPELQKELSLRQLHIPIVFITAHSLDSAKSAVMAGNVVACLLKPFSAAAILEAVRAAVSTS